MPVALDAGRTLAPSRDGGTGDHATASSALDAMPGAPPSAVCAEAEGALPPLRLTPVLTGLAQPTYALAPPGDAEHLFVLERAGVVRIVRDGRLEPTPFLDLSTRVATGGDQGLLGLAFHPGYADNGRLFVMYALRDPAAAPTDPGEIVVSELARSEDDAGRADEASERRLIQIDPPSSFHAGGQLAFDARGLLYIGVGDGGARAAGDRQSLLGKVLRIDVDRSTSERPYGIPDGNMSGPDVLPELWSYGLRNPWRFSFDPCTGTLLIGDVGEAEVEEIDLEPPDTPGRDYGWSRLEGSRCLEGADAGCDREGVTLPVLEYGRDFGCAVISGHVYRGQAIPALRGTYVYGDYCTGRIGGFRIMGDGIVDVRDLTAELNPDRVAPITSFALDARGELYVLTQTGDLYRLEPR